MSAPLSFGRLDDAPAVPPPAADSPFRIAVLGDFSGRAKAAPPADLATRRPVRVDPDDPDAALAAVAPTVTLNGLLGSPFDLTFLSFDDFEPDAIFRAVDGFSDLSDRESRTEYMRAILRHPRFRAVEAAWRSVDWLLRRGRKGDAKVELVLYDARGDEFAAALMAGDELSANPLYKLLVETAVHGPKGQPWAAVLGLYGVRVSSGYATVLGKMAKIAAAGGGPFLAGLAAEDTDPARVIPPDAAEGWARLRALPEAAAVGLAAPRVLLRPPYGEMTRSVEAFDFEEFTGPDDRAAYLWAEGGLAAAGAVAQGFARDGWRLNPGGPQDLPGMPVHSYRDDDGDEHLTVVERWLDRKAGERLTDLGVMSVYGVRGRDAVQLTRLHAVAGPPKEPPAELYARWGASAPAGPPRGGTGFKVAVMGAEGVPAAGVVAAATFAAPAPPKPTATPPAALATAPAAAVPAAPPPPTEPPPADDGLDPELAALLGSLGGDSPPPPAADAPPADDGLDPELAALLKDLG
jgi:hypothetical protein